MFQYESLVFQFVPLISLVHLVCSSCDVLNSKWYHIVELHWLSLSMFYSVTKSFSFKTSSLVFEFETEIIYW